MLKKYAGTPYVIWAIIFIVIPLLLVVFYGVTIEQADGSVRLSLENFQKFMQPEYTKAFWRSIQLALISTVICLLIGYPAAYMLTKIPKKRQMLLVMLFMVPMWMNFLLRTYAWLNILGTNGPLNQLLVYLGFEKVQFLFTDGAVLMGMVYNFLPFMVLPIYSVIVKIDNSLVEAARDLGANDFKVFSKVIFPLSLPGVVSGISMVFMPAVSTFVISSILGGGKVDLIGNVIQRQFMESRNWNFGSSLSVILMIVLITSMLLMNKYSDRENGGGGMGLW